jgi:hypothetical protein
MPPTDSKEEMIRENEKNFVEALHTEQSSLKYMTMEAKA